LFVVVSSKNGNKYIVSFGHFVRPNFQKTICDVLFGAFPERLFATGERPAMLERPGSNSSMNTSAPSFSYRGKWAEIDRMFLQLRQKFEGQLQKEEAEKRPGKTSGVGFFPDKTCIQKRQVFQRDGESFQHDSKVKFAMSGIVY